MIEEGPTARPTIWCSAINCKWNRLLSISSSTEFLSCLLIRPYQQPLTLFMGIQLYVGEPTAETLISEFTQFCMQRKHTSNPTAIHSLNSEWASDQRCSFSIITYAYSTLQPAPTLSEIQLSQRMPLVLWGKFGSSTQASCTGLYSRASPLSSTNTTLMPAASG